MLISFFILLNTLRIIHKNLIKTEGGGLLVVRWEIPRFSSLRILSVNLTTFQVFFFGWGHLKIPVYHS